MKKQKAVACKACNHFYLKPCDGKKADCGNLLALAARTQTASKASKSAKADKRRRA